MNRHPRFAVAILTLAISLLVANGALAQAWFDGNWSYRRAVTVSNPGGATLTAFQVQVTLAGSFDFSRARSDGGDLRVTAADGITPIPFWVEKWSPGSQQASLWVNVPTIPPVGTTLYLYYGNPGASGVSNGHDTFEFFDDFTSATAPGYYKTGSASTILVRDQAWETESPHTLSAVPAPAGASYHYYGYYGLQVCGGIGMAGSDDLLHWTKFATNPLFTGGGERWPSVILVDGTYTMVHTADYCSGSRIVYRTSADGLTWSSAQELVAKVPGQRNQNPCLYRDPASGQYYLYWHRGDDATYWKIMTRTSSTVAGLVSAPDIELLSSNEVLAAPSMMFRDATYFLSTEIYEEGLWKTRIYSGPSPVGPFSVLRGNPVLGDGCACLSQMPVGDTLYEYYCKETNGVWTVEARTADLSAGRQAYGEIDPARWAPSGGDWRAPVASQQDGTVGVVAEGNAPGLRILKSSFAGDDYVLEGYGRQLAGRVWGFGVRTSSVGNTYTLNLYDDHDTSNNLYLYRWNGGVATEIWKGAAGTIDRDTWYKLKIKVHGSSFDIYLNDVLMTPTPIVDAGFSSGALALYAETGTNAQYDVVRARKYAATEPLTSAGAERVQPPVVGTAGVVPVGDGHGVTIAWTTDVPADSRVDYGTTPESLGSSVTDAAQTAAHSLPLDGLTPNTTYYYRVSSARVNSDRAYQPPPGNPPASFTLSTYLITATAGPNGSIDPQGAVTVNWGASQAFSIAPDAHCHIVDVRVDDVSVGAVTGYTFTNVAGPHTIAASFAVSVHTITASSGAGGAISPLGAVAVTHGADQTFTLTPDAHYHVADIVVDGGSVGAAPGYTFTNVTADHTIAASFAIDTNDITATATAGGTISPAGVVAVAYGADQAFVIATDVGYHAVDVVVDGVPVGAVPGYTFTNVTVPHTIAASFAINVYTITATAGLNGAILPAGAVAVEHGADQTFTMTPDAGYHVADVVVDGVSAGRVTSYTFTNVTEPHTIAASFAINIYDITATATAGGTISPAGVVAVTHGADQAFAIAAEEHHHLVDVVVDGVSAGMVTSYTFTNVTEAHTIAASFAIDTHDITATAGLNGAISPLGAVAVAHGADQAFTMRPDAGYHVADIVVDGVSVGAMPVYTFTNVTGPHTIAASFAINVYTITATAGAGGTISPAGAVAVIHGADQAFTLTPDGHHHVADIAVDGSSVGAAPGYTFTNVTGSHTIAVSFAVDTYDITATATAGGTITPSGVVAAAYGADQAFAIAAEAHHHLVDVVVDGVPAGRVTSYTFTNVTETHTIAASFAIDTHDITATAGLNGSISPLGTVAVAHGADQAFTMRPDAGYHVADIVVDGVSVGAMPVYTFTNVTDAHTIAASFAINIYDITATATAGGTITPAGVVPVTHGADQAFAIAAEAHHHLVDVVVDGVSAGMITGYTFTNVTEAHAIAATFTPDQRTVTATATAGGGVTMSPDLPSYDFGSSVTLTARPDPGYTFTGWSGSASGSENPLTIVVDEDKTIVAGFADLTPPVLCVTAPNGGETWTIGYGYTISWTAQDAPGVTSVDLDYSTDGGATWTPIAAGIPNAGSHVWTASAPPSTAGRVRVSARDAAGNVGRDTSDADFEIRYPPAVRIVELRADSASGAGPYPIPGAAGPWTDLVGARNDASLRNFTGDSQSGWNGSGSSASPYRLEFAGQNECATMPAASVAELQNPVQGATAELWFRTPSDPQSGKYYYLFEWLDGGDLGMSMMVRDGKLLIYLRPWTNVATMLPATWHHVVVAKAPNVVRVFVDGRRVYSGGQSLLGPQSSEIVIGAARRGPGAFADFYRGAIAQVALWQGAVTDSQAHASYLADASRYHAGSVAVGVPGAGFALAGLTPNPAWRNLRVSFTLASAAPASLELLDLAGRRVRERAVGMLGPGTHNVDLGDGVMPAAGVYWIRLAQGGRALVRKAIVIR